MIVGAKKTSICNECVKLCVEILEEDTVKARKEKLYSGDKNILNPVAIKDHLDQCVICLLYTSPSPRDLSTSRMPSSA